MVGGSVDLKLRAATDTVSDYLNKCRIGEEEQAEHGWLVHVKHHRFLVTTNGKPWVQVFFETYGGKRIVVDYWIQRLWFKQRMRKLHEVCYSLHPDTWFWLKPVLKVNGNSREFYDYTPRSIDEQA